MPRDEALRRAFKELADSVSFSVLMGVPVSAPKIDEALPDLATAELADGKLRPPKSISAAVAVKRYRVTRKTLYAAVKDGRLTDHRAPGHADNAPLRLDEAEVANIWKSR